MADIDDIKAAQADTKVALTAQADALANIATDLDELIAKANTPGADLREVAADAVSIRDTAQALAAAAKTASERWPAETPPPTPEG